MAKRISSLKESPCYQCKCMEKCLEKISTNSKFQEIQDSIFANADFDYHNCSIWIALNAPEMIEE